MTRTAHCSCGVLRVEVSGDPDVVGTCHCGECPVTEPFRLLSVEPSQLEYTPIEYQRYSKAHAEKVLGVVCDAVRLAGVVCDTLHVEHEQVYQAIIAAAQARKCDLIVMASDGRRGV